MTTWGPILLYTLIVVWSGLVALPFCQLIFDDVRRVPLLSVSLTIGFPLTLTAFTLLARVNPNYSIIVPTLIIGSTVSSALLWHFSAEEVKRPRKLSWDLPADLGILGLNLLLLLAAVAIRTNWPSIFWDNTYNHHGVEKLFNLSMMQAFVLGKGFPPENLWNLGQPIDYYILMHSLPGLAAWGWRMVSGDPAGCGVLFVFSDAFLFSMGSLALSAWSYALLLKFSPELTRRQASIISIGLSVGVSLAAHPHAIAHVFTSLLGGQPFIGWRNLQYNVVPGTVAQYPLWTLLLGDHHAFQRAYFLQVAFISQFLLLLCSERLHLPRCILAGALSAAVLLYHPGSAMIDAIICGPAILASGLVWLRKRQWNALYPLGMNLLTTSLLAGLLSLPRLLEIQPTVANWYWVERSIASPLAGFLSVQFGPLLFLTLAAGARLIVAKNSWARGWWALASLVLMGLSLFGLGTQLLLPLGFIMGSATLLWPKLYADGPHPVRQMPRVIPRLCIFAVIIILVVLGRPAAAVAVTCSAVVLLFSPRLTSENIPLISIAGTLFLIWLIPEFVVIESPVFGNGPGKRFNLTMRFWLEGYYLVPLLAVVIWSPLYPAIFARKSIRRTYGILGLFISALWIITHGRAVADRIMTTGDQAGINGAAVLGRLAPKDAAIVTYLKNLPEPVHVGELCGTGEVIQGLPSHYDWPGRIAAFSARPGLCGWTRHVWQVGTRLRNPAATGPWSWVRFREYERNLQAAYNAALNNVPAPKSREFLQSLGITHLVVGEGEQRLFPGLAADALAKATGGEVVFSGEGGTGLVSLKGEKRVPIAF